MPDYYDPVYQEEQRQREWDEIAEDIPVCSCCNRQVHPNDKFYEVGQIILCSDCKAELDESERILDLS